MFIQYVLQLYFFQPIGICGFKGFNNNFCACGYTNALAKIGIFLITSNFFYFFFA